MILMTMTPEEVYDQMLYDIGTILGERIRQAMLHWRRYIRKRCISSTQRIVQSLKLQAGRQQYLIVFTCYSRRQVGLAIFAVVQTEERVYYVNMPQSKDNTHVMAYTDHFFYRYAERLHLPQHDIQSIMCHYYTHNACEFCIYTDNDDSPRNLVYMVPDGLELARVTKNKWLICRTFISVDLLKTTQRESFRTLMPAYEYYVDNVYHRRLQGIFDTSSVGDYINQHYESELTEAQNIYAQFFEE